MNKSLAGLAAAAALAAFATAGPAGAAEQRQAPGVHPDQQNVTEEFSSQRRYRYRQYRYARPRVVVPRYRTYRPYAYPYAYSYPYAYPYAYSYPYRYRYYRPGVSFGFGPFGFNVW